MTLLFHLLYRMGTCENMKGGGVAILSHKTHGTHIKMHWKASCTCGMVQRAIWLRGMPFVVLLVSSRFRKRVSNARKYERVQ